MKTYLHALIMCQSMFCALPAAQVWDEKARDKMLLFLPAVGLEIGAIWAALGWLCRLLVLPPMVTALVLCAAPYLLTGFLHLDGFMDVVDAVGSCRDLERRRAILKDPHVGSFAVIGLALLLLAQFALFASAPADRAVLSLLLIPVVSRCCSALAVGCLKPMTTSQYAGHTARKGHVIALSAMLAVAVAAGFLLWGKYGLVSVGCLVGYGVALWRAYHGLQGMNGDIAGFSLIIGELCAVAVYGLL